MIAGPASPVGAADFARLMAPFEPFESAPVLAVGVSGGRDSLALALLARDWAAARGGRVTGLIVDHGLRAGVRRRGGGNARSTGPPGQSKAPFCTGPAPSRRPACRRRRGPRATGCCARRAAAAASSICCSAITPTTRPRRWRCAPPAAAAPTASPAWRRRSSSRSCGCCAPCSPCRGRASRRHSSHAACNGSTIPRMPIRASNGRGCARSGRRSPGRRRRRRRARGARAGPGPGRRRGAGVRPERHGCHRSGGLCRAGPGRAGGPAQPGGAGRGRARPSAAPRSPAAGGGAPVRPVGSAESRAKRRISRFPLAG